MSNLSRRTFLTSSAGLLATSACSTASANRTATRPVKFERQRFIEDVRRAAAQGQGSVEEVIARAVSEPGSVLAELGEPDHWAIDRLYSDDGLSIFKIVWPPLTVLGPHDHLMWASIGVYAGRENNIMWKRSGSSIEATTAASVAAKEVFSLPLDAIHSVTNPVEGYTAALHVYGGDLSATKRSQWDGLILREEAFDVVEGGRILRQADARFRRG